MLSGIADNVSMNLQTFIVGKKCWLTGWRKTDPNGNFSNVLRQAPLPVVTNPVCRKGK